jgi:hypothetical protein
MPSLEEYARQSAFSNPGRYAELLDPLTAGVREIAAVVRNIVVHYRAAGITFTGDRLAEIDSRWIDRVLATDQGRFPVPLAEPRPPAERVAGCCRDFTLLTVAALRHHGVPARSRIGFAGYFDPNFHHDHVVVEYWDGTRWVFADAQLDPGSHWPFDTCDLPRLVGAKPAAPPVFATAAQTWSAYRRGDIDVDRYGVDPNLPIRGGWFVRNYVLQELAHRQRDELLLWDGWGAMAEELSGDLGLVDEVADLLLAADDGDASAERELSSRYAEDRRLNPGGRVTCRSPAGTVDTIDLGTREPA